MDIDAVITYVNNQDPNWQRVYEEAHPELVKEDLSARYRDYGTLPYLLRGIEANMPWIRNVYLVVKFDSQVPSWINRDEVRVVLEDEIVPSEYLPTFNSTTIEAFLHMIPGLSEHFIYFNDDMFPMTPMDVEDFFVDGLPVVYTKENSIPGNPNAATLRKPANVIYSSATRFLTDRLGYVYDDTHYFTVPHVAQAFRKSTFEHLHEEYGDDIRSTLTKFRDPGNLAHYIYSVYEAINGTAVHKRIPYAYLRLVSEAVRLKVGDVIRSSRWKMICVNDVNAASETADAFENMRITLIHSFSSVFPNASKYEIRDQDLSWLDLTRVISAPGIPMKDEYKHMGRAVADIFVAGSFSNVIPYSDIRCGCDVMKSIPKVFTILFRDHEPLRCTKIASTPFGAIYTSPDIGIVTLDKRRNIITM